MTILDILLLLSKLDGGLDNGRYNHLGTMGKKSINITDTPNMPSDLTELLNQPWSYMLPDFLS